MKLRRTIRSIVKPETIYGDAGEAIKQICDCGNVLIVEGCRGRFPVSKADVTQDATAIIIEEEKIFINQAPVKKQKRKPAPQNSQTLF
ncbi:MAG TPA: hypothetical protein PL045_09160 [Chitinophagaceae bacterium]|nr:hypothetical protein [Chitinophagaceae bacterium]